MPSQIAGSPPQGPPEPTGGKSHRAGPSQPRRRGERRVRHRAPDTLVEAALHAIADAGSIPAVSTLNSETLRFPDRELGRLSRGGPAAGSSRTRVRCCNRRRLRAVLGARRAVAAVAQGDEQVAQLVALVCAQPGEDGVLGLALRLGGALQLAPARVVRATNPSASSGLSSVTRMLGSVAMAWPSSRWPSARRHRAGVLRQP